MNRSTLAAFGTALLALSLTACTGGEEGHAQTTSAATPAPSNPARQIQVDPPRQLHAISPAIPVYRGAVYRSDLTRRDSVEVQHEYGPDSVVYTLATQDSFPQVWHYYVTYLAQFRAFDPMPAYPPSGEVSRSIEVRLNQAMKDPFIPGDSFDANDEQVVLQVAENSAGSGSVIRYIVSPAPAPPQSLASAASHAAGDAQ